jgi:hypothetical protein
MVTTPDDYPIWRTRRPVIVVLHKKSAQIQHHYYRYMVVTPGGSEQETHVLLGQQDHIMQGGTTSNEDLEVSSVMAWEDPYWQQHLHHEPSNASMVSMENSNTQKRYLASLPYRTLDISIAEGKVIVDPDIPQWNVSQWIVGTVETMPRFVPISFGKRLMRRIAKSMREKA